MLGSKGLTSSEASRVANFLKEIVKGIDVNADDFKIVAKTAMKDGEVLHLDNNARIDDWAEKLQAKARYFALSAWLKEAIKEKENRFDEEVRTTFNDSTIDIDLLEILNVSRPIAPSVSFEFFFKNVLNIKEQAQYLKEEASAAHIGKFIHNFDTIRTTLREYKPNDLQQFGGIEVLTIKNVLLYSSEELLEEHEKLQKIHRESEKILNFYRAKHKEWVADESRKYQLAIDEYTALERDVKIKNNAVVQKYRTAFENDKTLRLEEIRQLKIEIPNDLQPILDEVYKKLEG